MELVHTYTTKNGLEIRRLDKAIDGPPAVEGIVAALDEQKGVLLTSNYEYPGRYSRWDIGFVNPPLELRTKDDEFAIRALNDRGQVLLSFISENFVQDSFYKDLRFSSDQITGGIIRSDAFFSEEERSKQPSIFSLLRMIIELFSSDEDRFLGLYGAYGYDLVFQFESIKLSLSRDEKQADLVLYLPDEIVVIDHAENLSQRFQYDFSFDGQSTQTMARSGSRQPFASHDGAVEQRELEKNQYAEVVKKAKDYFIRGNLFEVVPSHTFFRQCKLRPSDISRKLRTQNPAPYGIFMNLGSEEYLIGASPEMYVRVEGSRVETCPISGTIARGQDPIEDSHQIRELLNSSKDLAELTMCTDVDRNDKSRVCKPGTVKVLGRRQIELYSRVIHTVDHVEGALKDEFDGLDAFLSHMWAVTVTGAPKMKAIKFIEQHEQSSRFWYGGAIGSVHFNGNVNTGLTLRTIHVCQGIANVRAGATVLFDSDPVSEEEETEVKASAFLKILDEEATSPRPASATSRPRPGEGKRILLVDFDDSFVHTLSNYFGQTGAEVVTLRHSFVKENLVEYVEKYASDLLVLSPGPGHPSEYPIQMLVEVAIEKRVPVFGVCLGLQGIVQCFGGELGTLSEPMHGKSSDVRILERGRIFPEGATDFAVGRYHSLFATQDSMPKELMVTAMSDDDVVMGIEHKQLPIAAVQFHPESIMTMQEDLGYQIIENVVCKLRY